MAFTFFFSGLFLLNTFNPYPFSNEYPLMTTDSIPGKWIEKPLNYSAERTRLSLAYLKDRYGIDRTLPIIDPQMIVLHFTNGGTAGSIYNYFNTAIIESARSFNKSASDLNVSSHYLVDRDGTVYRFMPDTLFARHIIGLNHCAIGIENIGSGEQPLTDQQVKANIGLIRDICSRYPIRYLIGHSEYGVFRGSPLWKERDPDYFTSKGDPGSQFMEKVRKGVRDLPLRSKPE